MSAEKTEDPTPKKLRDARKKGQVAKSKEVSSTIGIICVVSLLWALSDWFLLLFQEIVLFPAQVYNMEFMTAVKAVIMGISTKSLMLIIPLVIVSAVAAILGNVIQFGLLFSLDPIKPDIKKINPIQGAKKIFALKNLIEFIKSIIKIVFLSTVVYYVIKTNMQELMNMPWCGASCILPVAGHLLKKLILYAIVAFIVISIADFMFEKYQFTKEQRMTKDEVKREYKESEGNPEIKGKRKQLHQELVNSEGEIKQSDVVIKNPTHIAVGLYYKQEKTPLPVVTSLGKRSQATFILHVAEQHNIPVIENIALARALYNQAEVGNFIPSELISPVAEVFRWVQQLKNEKENEIS
ncbi:MAG: type III secretion system export apparatus subunit SctU [Endozoicomonadaceae bacterium]|nr:type III secretion system export apparatus subunit SctU [Endozoicomonadaceae bacterium]